MDTALIFLEAAPALNAEKSMYQWKQQNFSLPGAPLRYESALPFTIVLSSEGRNLLLDSGMEPTAGTSINKKGGAISTPPAAFSRKT
jgi:hypothetical protein